MARTTTPPGTIDYSSARTDTAPGSIDHAGDRTDDAPAADDHSEDRTETAPEADDHSGDRTATAPTVDDHSHDRTTTPAVPLNPDDTPVSVPAMPSAFRPAFIELTGAGAALASVTASAADAASGRILQGTVAGELKSYQVRAGDDAQDLPGIVRPANFDADTNAVVFVQL